MRSLILVDLQNDFCPGGSLPVPDGNKTIPLINSLQEHFDLIVATKDWHPKDHLSFAINHGKKVGEVIRLNGIVQVLWPVHCVQNTKGAEFISNLNTKKILKIFKKGTDKKVDSYSGFFDNDHKKSTGLYEYLKDKKVTDVYIVGLATDYCVKYTALDAVRLGFNTIVIEDATRGVNLKSNDVKKAIEEMKKKDVKIIQSKDIS